MAKAAKLVKGKGDMICDLCGACADPDCCNPQKGLWLTFKPVVFKTPSTIIFFGASDTGDPLVFCPRCTVKVLEKLNKAGVNLS